MAKPRQKSSDHESNVVFLRHASTAAKKKTKPRWNDPAAAPPGTDAEAAGTPQAADQVAAMAQAEMSRQVRNGDLSSRRQSSTATAVILVAIALTALVTTVAILWTRA